MKIAYIVDGAIESTKNRSNKDVYTLPYKRFINQNLLIKEENNKVINDLLKSSDGSQFLIAPTPGEYRDLFVKLKKDNYEYVIVIPSLKDMSLSHFNANYATRFMNEDIKIIDITGLATNSNVILDHLLNKHKLEEETGTIFDIEEIIRVLFDQLRNLKRLAKKYNIIEKELIT